MKFYKYFFSLSDQLLQGSHQDHHLPAFGRRDVHQRAAQISNLQPGDDREIRLRCRARLEADLHLGKGGHHAEGIQVDCFFAAAKFTSSATKSRYRQKLISNSNLSFFSRIFKSHKSN